MIGSRPISTSEMELLTLCFQKRRTAVFFKLVVQTGFRPAEALSLQVQDVAGKDRVTVWRRNVKGRTRSRSLFLGPALRQAIQTYLVQESLNCGPLFPARAGRPVTYRVMARDFRAAVERANLKGKVTLHSGRKTFAKFVYEHSGKDIHFTAQSLGHSSPQNTFSYLSFDTEKLDQMVAQMPVPL